MGDTRDRIREAALELFRAKGYARTSIAEIERSAGLAPRAGGFYRHFQSKAELAAEIGQTSVIESRRELGFDGILPLADTRSELILIAKGYRKAHERQAPLAALIAEVQHLEEIQRLEARVNEELRGELTGWLAAKAFAAGKTDIELTAMVLSVFGGWLFYLTKRGTDALPVELTDERMLDEWADLWAGILDRAP